MSIRGSVDNGAFSTHDAASGKIIANAEVVKVDDKFGVRVTEV